MRSAQKLLMSVLVAALTAGLSHAQGIPPQLVIRHAAMKSDLIVVGEMVSVFPYDRTVSPRAGVLLVDRCVYGLVDAGDSVRVQWHADRWYPSKDVAYAVADGDLDLDTVMHRRALWCLGPRGAFESLCRPIFVDETLPDLFAAMIANLEQSAQSAPNLMAEDRQLELRGDSLLKRNAVAAYLRQEIEQVKRLGR